MTSARPPRPLRIAQFPNGEIGVAWSDDHESFYSARGLRCACACAKCVDEVTGTKVLRDESVPRDVEASKIHQVGNYGVAIHWSDGHDTGIYSYERLRSLCPCDRCAAG